MTGLNDEILKQFGLNTPDLRTYSPLTLAYIGDSVFDIIVRSIIVNKGNTKVQLLHKTASGIVNARMQARFVEKISPLFTEEEESIYKRGKNAKPHTVAKNATLSEYHRATGFEAVLGYLYLKGDSDRLFFLVKSAFEGIEDSF